MLNINYRSQHKAHIDKAHSNRVTRKLTENYKHSRVREGNLDTRGIWTLTMFKTSNLFSLSDTQLMKTVPGSFDTCF